MTPGTDRSMKIGVLRRDVLIMINEYHYKGLLVYWK